MGRRTDRRIEGSREASRGGLGREAEPGFLEIERGWAKAQTFIKRERVGDENRCTHSPDAKIFRRSVSLPRTSL